MPFSYAAIGPLTAVAILLLVGALATAMPGFVHSAGENEMGGMCKADIDRLIAMQPD